MKQKLLVFNPSDYPRSGHVVTAWLPIADATGNNPDAFQLVTERGQAVPAQVDRIDPSDHRLDMLAFTLPDNLAPGPEDYSQPSAAVFLESVQLSQSTNSTTSPPVGLPARTELANGTLTISFSILPCQDESHGDWFAGSAQSVRIGAVEILDFWRSITGLTEHDPEKRCMQVDRLTIPKPAWASEPEQVVPLFNLPYRLVSYCAGPVRQTCTMVSTPFEYVCTGPSNKWSAKLECSLYRTLILYNFADFLLEELWLKGRDLQADGKGVDLWFSARYFSYMDFGFDPVVFRYDAVPDWFAIGCPYSDFCPGYGYGFATDVHARQLKYPHPEYPIGVKSYKSLSWELHPSKKARCLHLFQLGGPESIERRTGHAWYEEIYKPLNKAELG